MKFKEYIKSKLIIALSVLVLFSLVIMLKFISLKFYDKDSFSVPNIEQRRDYKGKRGDILSVNHKILATSVIRYDIKFDPLTEYLKEHPEYYKENLPKLCDSLSKYLGKATPGYYKTKIETAKKRNVRYLPLESNITYMQKLRIENFPFFELGTIRGGGIFVKRYARFHPFEGLADITIGLYKKNDDKLIIKGLEHSYNSTLEGTPGTALYRKGPSGNDILFEVLTAPEDGADLLTTLDMNIQYFLEMALLKRLRELQANHGVGIIMDVRSGEIRAMANLVYDSTKHEYKELRNMAIQWLYAPGSVVKPFSMIALFEEYPNIPLSLSVATGKGELKVNDFVFRDDKKGGYGTISLEAVVAKSSNVGVVKTILRYFKDNPDKFINRLEEIGLSKKTMIDLDGERTAEIKDPSSKYWWSNVSLGQIAIGYEHKMTPIQILALYNAIANNGIYVTPHLVKAIIKNGKVKPNTQFKNRSRVIASKKTIAKVRKMLEAVVKYGTAHKTVKSSLISIAGKTGTAKMYEQGKIYEGNKYNTTFVGYFPVDKPKYSMIVVISAPKKDRSGAKAAGPVFKKVAEQIYRYDHSLRNIHNITVNNWAEKNIVPKIQSGYKPNIFYLLQAFGLPYEDNSRNSNWVAVITMEHKEELIPYNFKDKKKPNVKTMSPIDASWILENQGYRTMLHGAGKVVGQSFNEKTVKLYLK